MGKNEVSCQQTEKIRLSVTKHISWAAILRPRFNPDLFMTIKSNFEG